MLFFVTKQLFSHQNACVDPLHKEEHYLAEGYRFSSDYFVDTGIGHVLMKSTQIWCIFILYCDCFDINIIK